MAAKYVEELRFAVFPLHTPTADGCSCGKPDCSSIGKHPRTSRGLHDATQDIGIIIGWWSEWPNANVGVRTGNSLIVLDIDGPEGEQSLKTLGTLPTTWESRTGRGRHVWFR